VASGLTSPNECAPPSIDGLDDTLGKQDGAHDVHRPRAEDGVGEDGAAAGSEGGTTPVGDVAVDGLHQRLEVGCPNLGCGQWKPQVCLGEGGDCETWVPLGPHRPGSWPSPTSGSDLLEDPPTCQWAQPT
jgi:hypothetical protein